MMGDPTRTTTKLMTAPPLTMSLIPILFVANATEFGGVAAGSMNANEQATVAGSIMARGWVKVCMATDAKMGSMMFAVAVLDVTSVRKVTQQTRR
mmetsp:Transcript_71482/g.190106  ORF Transcript_71482/g.190106 Transcript_71482/m.190106 type:complete len:95 (-) Transcript_71482:1181-1465(-)